MSNTYREATIIDTQACQSLRPKPMTFVLRSRLTRRFLSSKSGGSRKGGLSTEPTKSGEGHPEKLQACEERFSEEDSHTRRGEDKEMDTPGELIWQF